MSSMKRMLFCLAVLLLTHSALAESPRLPSFDTQSGPRLAGARRRPTPAFPKSDGRALNHWGGR